MMSSAENFTEIYMNYSTAGSGNTENITCIVSTRTHHYIEMSLNTVSLAINLFLCVSIVVYRRKLRQHLINLYAANLVFSNLVMILAFTTVSYFEYFGYSREPNPKGEIPASLLKLWFVMKVVSIVMFLVICAGIGLLMVAMKKNMFRVHRTVAGLSRESVQTLNSRDKETDRKRDSLSYRFSHWAKKNPKSFAGLQIVLVWTIPIFFSTAAYYDGASCLEKCQCKMNFIPANHTMPACPVNSNCNEVIPSMNNTTIIAAFSFWVLCIFVIALMFVRSYFNFIQIMKERKEAMKAQSLDGDPRRRESQVEKMREKNDQITDSSSPKMLKPSSPNRKGKTSTLDRVGTHLNWNHYPKSLLSESLKRNILFLVLIAVVFIVGTGPFVITAFVSVYYDLEFVFRKDNVIIPIGNLPVLTTIFNSFILCGNHFGLNIAIRSMVRAIVHCHCFKKKK